MSDIAEMKKKLEEHLEKEEEMIKDFDLDQAIKDSQNIREVTIEGLGRVRYGLLTVGDLLALASVKDDTEVMINALTRMLKKANPSVTPDKVKQLPTGVFWKLVKALGREMIFLPEVELKEQKSSSEGGK
jgi:translation elongation factor EF-Tu-like GTPase